MAISKIKGHLENIDFSSEIKEVKKTSSKKKVRTNNRVRVSINGFGRIGRMILRAGIDDDKIDFVCINNTHGIDDTIYYLKYDSAHGTFKYDIVKKDDFIIIKTKTRTHKIKVIREREIENLPWKKLKIDVVMECTGAFTKYELAKKHILVGAKKVIISAPSKSDGCFYFLRGVNDNKYKGEDVVSNASCTTNSVAAIINEINKKYGVENGLFSTVHSLTLDQKTLDSSHSDFRRGRSSAFNIIPTTTGAQKAILEIIPSLKDKLSGVSYRVPTIDGSLTDLNLKLKKKTNMKNLKAFFEKLSNEKLKEIVGFSEENLVSTDIIGNSNSGIIDFNMTKLIGGDFLKLVVWYDNEWGFSNRMVEVAKIISKTKKSKSKTFIN